MEQAAKKANQFLESQPASEEQTRTETARCSDEDVLAIWERMGSIYGHKWTGTYGEKIDPVWKRALQSMPVDRLKLALARCARRDDAWPPSLPEFMALAEVWPEEVGAPDETAAFHEACRGAHPCNTRAHRWGHRCVYWAAVWTGLVELYERPNRARKAFAKNYQAALESYSELDEPPAAELPYHPPEPSPEADAAAEQALADMKRALGA